jgi:hypothetical protein
MVFARGDGEVSGFANHIFQLLLFYVYLVDKLNSIQEGSQRGWYTEAYTYSDE